MRVLSAHGSVHSVSLIIVPAPAAANTNNLFLFQPSDAFWKIFFSSLAHTRLWASDTFKNRQFMLRHGWRMLEQRRSSCRDELAELHG